VDAFDGADVASVTSRLISNSYLAIGLDRLVGDRPGFVNFDRQSIVEGVPEMLSPDSVVVEILETVEPDDEVLAAVTRLKRKGYRLALDDFVCADGFEPLMELADIVKVDFRLCQAAEWERLPERLRRWDVELLAEKVETREEFRAAAEVGYRYFQGYFFSRPSIVTGRQIPGYKLNYMRILSEVSNRRLDFGRIEELLKREASLVHKLLQYVNSAHFGWNREVESIPHALVLLGETEIRKWIALTTFTGVASDKPMQLVVDAVTRARFCEQLSRQIGLGARSSELFLLGMYSLLHALLDRPIEEIIAEVHLAEDVRAVLLGDPCPTPGLLELLRLAMAYEDVNWEVLETTSPEIGLDMTPVADCYVGAVEWADQVFRR
jgi:EAL and modified HD-GYP domain-containing signal transduction protein